MSEESNKKLGGQEPLPSLDDLVIASKGSMYRSNKEFSSIVSTVERLKDLYDKEVKHSEILVHRYEEMGKELIRARRKLREYRSAFWFTFAVCIVELIVIIYLLSR